MSFLWSRYLTIIPRARMGSESILPMKPKAEWAIDRPRGHEGESNNYFGKIQLQLVKNIENKKMLAR